MTSKLPTSIQDLQSGLINNKHTAVDLVDSYISRVKNHDKNINSVLTLAEEHAYSQAKSVDRYIKNNGKEAFEQKPLLGTVVGHKDLFSTKGIRTTAGSKVLEDYIPQYSATVVKKLEASGAITLAKLNCDAWAHGGSGENSDFGDTKNPWDDSRVPGGSSSGSAAALAADFATITTGTDTGGSIRQPAGFCGVVGFKPTYGAVSRYGVIAMGSSLDSVGHFAHSVEDIKKVFEVTKGADNLDGNVVNDAKNTKPKKIGILKEFTEGLDKGIEANFQDTISLLKNKGYEVTEISIPAIKHSIATYYIIMPAEVSSNLGRYDGLRFGNKRDAFGEEAKRRIMLGSYVLSSGYYDAYYKKAMQVRSILISEFEKAFDNVDAIITPTSPTSAFKLGENIADPLKMYLQDIFLAAANLTGIPGIAIPNGLANGLPTSFQILAPRFAENRLFELGKEYQTKTDWHKKKPDL